MTYGELLHAAQRLVSLLHEIGASHTWDDEAKLAEIKRLNFELAPVYLQLHGGVPLITTSYPPYVWHKRAVEQASDALAFLEANPGWQRAEAPVATSSATEESGATEGTPFQSSAFLLMPFDPELDWLRDEIGAAGEDAGVPVIRADNIFEAGVVIDQVEEAIRGAAAVIAVCTGKNPNVFYELGIARMSGHRPILVAESSQDLPFDIQHFRAQLYGGSSGADGRQTLRERIAQALRETISSRSS